jgi:ribosomal protein L35
MFTTETLVTVCHNLQRHIAEDRSLGSLKRNLRNTSINAEAQFRTLENKLLATP